MIFFRKNSVDYKISNYLRRVLGFKPNSIEVYKMAFIHRSASIHDSSFGKLNNERLEYLGDAILGAIVADYLYKKFPLDNEGDLTQMRSKLVCRQRLNSLAHTIGLHNFISYESNQSKSAEGDAFEALVGALFIDKGYNKTKQIVLNIFNTHLDLESVFNEENNFKSLLINWGQRGNRHIHFENEPFLSNGKKLHKSFAYVDDEIYGEGLDYTIKKSEQFAAEAAWKKINENNGEK